MLTDRTKPSKPERADEHCAIAADIVKRGTTWDGSEPEEDVEELIAQALADAYAAGQASRAQLPEASAQCGDKIEDPCEGSPATCTRPIGHSGDHSNGASAWFRVRDNSFREVQEASTKAWEPKIGDRVRRKLNGELGTVVPHMSRVQLDAGQRFDFYADDIEPAPTKVEPVCPTCKTTDLPYCSDGFHAPQPEAAEQDRPDFQFVRDCINQAIGEVHGPDVDALIDAMIELTAIVEGLSGGKAYYRERAASAAKP